MWNCLIAVHFGGMRSKDKLSPEIKIGYLYMLTHKEKFLILKLMTNIMAAVARHEHAKILKEEVVIILNPGNNEIL